MKHAPLWIFLFALAIRVLIIGLTRFDGLYGQDAYAYYDYARQLLTTPYGTPLPGPVYWPLGYPALAALFLSFTGLVPFGAQLASVLTGSLIAPLVYLITLELTPKLPNTYTPIFTHLEDTHALTAALLISLSGQLLQSSISIMADAPALFWATFSAYALLRWDRTREWFWFPLAAATLALAIVTRWIFVGLIAPFGLFGLVAYRGSLIAYRISPTSQTFSISHVPPYAQAPILLSFLLFLFILLPQLLFSQVSAAPVLQHGWVVNWNLLNAFRTSFDNPDGHFDYRRPPALFYAEPFFHPYYLFPLLTPFVFVGAWALRRSRALILLGGWALVLYLYLIGLPYENFRFGLAYFPPIAIFAALGLHSLALDPWPLALDPWPLALSPLRFVLRPWLFVLLAILLSLPFTYRGLSSFLAIKSREMAATHYLQSEIPPRSTVLTFGLTLTLEHYTDFQAVELYAQTPETLKPLVCSYSPVYLFVEGENIATQWAGKFPEINVRWLRAWAGLQEIGKQGTWTLYSIHNWRCP